jgi:hypothetical protein
MHCAETLLDVPIPLPNDVPKEVLRKEGEGLSLVVLWVIVIVIVICWILTHLEELGQFG